MQSMINDNPSRLGRVLIPIVGLSLIAACGGDSGNGGDGNGQDGTLYPATYDCTTVADSPQNLIEADLSDTPRPRTTAEVLAMEATGSFIASRERYNRVVAELTGMRSQYPDETTFIQACHEPNKLTISFDDSTYATFENGDYTDWDNLNGALDRIAADPNDQDQSVTLTFDGRYNIPRLEQEYGALDGVTSADGIPTSDDEDVCLAIRGDMHFYIFRTAYGTCEDGCDSEFFSAFEADPSGNFSRVGLYNDNDDPPDWFTNAEDCRAFLKGQDVTAQ